MSLRAKIEPIVLDFKRPSGTSRGVLTQKYSWLIHLWDLENPKVIGVGECSIIKTLSPDWHEDYENDLNHLIESQELLSNFNHPWFKDKPSIKFGLETALLDLKNGGKKILFESEFTEGKKGIKINGLIWMGKKSFMLEQIEDKLNHGFDCIKLKIGAIDFDSELELLDFIRSKFSSDIIEIRVDANGAFLPSVASEKLKRLSSFDIHSIEQPIKQGQFSEMYKLCLENNLDIALDEELIGVKKEDRDDLLDAIKPQYIILKPSLIGGFGECNDWIERCEERNIKWWITSALESNIGLNAIAQWTFVLGSSLPQGLGTGQLYVNNIISPLQIEEGFLYHR